MTFPAPTFMKFTNSLWHINFLPNWWPSVLHIQQLLKLVLLSLLISTEIKTVKCNQDFIYTFNYNKNIFTHYYKWSRMAELIQWLEDNGWIPRLQRLTRPDLGPLSIIMTRLLATCWHGDEEASWWEGMHCARTYLKNFISISQRSPLTALTE
jgi:hypothetical protein